MESDLGDYANGNSAAEQTVTSTREYELRNGAPSEIANLQASAGVGGGGGKPA